MHTLSWIADSSFPTRLTIALLHFLWQGCCGGVLVVVGGSLLRNASAHHRYTLNVGVMLLMAICLPLTYRGIEISAARVDKTAVRKIDHGLGHASSAPNELPVSSTARIVPSASASASALTETQKLSDESTATTESGRTPAQINSSTISVKTPRLNYQPAIAGQAFQSLSRWVAALYVFGVSLILGRLLYGVWGGNRLCQSAGVIKDQSLLEMVGDLAHRLGLKAAPGQVACVRTNHSSGRRRNCEGLDAVAHHCCERSDAESVAGALVPARVAARSPLRSRYRICSSESSRPSCFFIPWCGMSAAESALNGNWQPTTWYWRRVGIDRSTRIFGWFVWQSFRQRYHVRGLL